VVAVVHQEIMTLQCKLVRVVLEVVVLGRLQLVQ
jgi:hypothetical protein